MFIKKGFSFFGGFIGMKITRNIFAISGVFIVLSMFILFSLAGFAEDYGGTNSYTTLIPWDNVVVKAPVSINDAAQNQSFVIGNYLSVFGDGQSGSSLTQGVQYTIAFNNPNWLNPYSFSCNNRLTLAFDENNYVTNQITSVINFPLYNAENQNVSFQFTCKNVNLRGYDFYQFLNDLQYSCVYTSSGSSLTRCMITLSYKVLDINKYFGSDGSFLFTTSHASSNSFNSVVTYPGSSLSMLFPMHSNNNQTITASDFRNIVDSYASDIHYTDSGALNDPIHKGLSNVLSFQDIVLTFSFQGASGSRAVFTCVQDVMMNRNNLMPTNGSSNLVGVTIDGGDVSFEPLVNSVSSFFDLRIGGDNGISLAQLGLFGLGLVLVIILIKFFKGG